MILFGDIKTFPTNHTRKDLSNSNQESSHIYRFYIFFYKFHEIPNYKRYEKTRLNICLIGSLGGNWFDLNPLLEKGHHKNSGNCDTQTNHG